MAETKLKAVVWHDPRIEENENAFLAETIVGELHKFKTFEETLAHLDQRTSTCILISSGTNGEKLFDNIYTANTTKYRRKITKAAIFCMDVKKHSQWVKDKDYKMIMSVESDPVKVLDILRKLWDDYNSEGNHNPKDEKKNDYNIDNKYTYEKEKNQYQGNKSEKSGGYGYNGYNNNNGQDKKNDYQNKGYTQDKKDNPNDYKNNKTDGNKGYQKKEEKKDPNNPFPYYNQSNKDSDSDDDNKYQDYKVDYK